MVNFGPAKCATSPAERNDSGRRLYRRSILQRDGRYLDWIRAQADVKDYFSEAADILRNKGIVHRVRIS